MKFAKLKLVRKNAVGGQITYEAKAWNEIRSAMSGASPDHRGTGYGDTVEDAKKSAVRAVYDAHRAWMLA